MLTSPRIHQIADDGPTPWPEAPDFGAGEIARAVDALGPRELFCHAFTDPEEHAHELEPLFHWAVAALESARPPPLALRRPEDFLDGLCGWASRSLMPTPLAHHAPSWPVRVVREFAPAGLSDGAWLRGALRSERIDGALARGVLRQFELHFGDPERSEGRAERYAMLLESIGVPPGSIARWEAPMAAPCSDVSYEHALLGLALGFFPAAFWPEAIGFNLWASCIGPAPLLGRLAAELRARGADLRYLESDGDALRAGARELALEALRERAEPGHFWRLARGFAAAHASYQNWEQAMLGPNVPFTPWDSVIDMVRRKARFAAAHHSNVFVGKRNLEQLLLDGDAAHEWLVDRLRTSPLIRPGDPAGSRLLSHSLSIEGPMFDAFTPREKEDLRAWIAGIGTRDDVRTNTPPAPLRGVYGPALDPVRLQAYARQRYGRLEPDALQDLLARPDEHPGLTVFARELGERWLRRLDAAFADPRLADERPPDRQHEPSALFAAAAARSRGEGSDAADGSSPSGCAPLALACGFWLHGFSDLRRAAFDDHRWCFHAYCRMPLRPVRAHGTVGLFAALLALNTPRFVPELLGIQVAAAYASPAWELVAGSRAADGEERRRCAAAAARAFMRRVHDAAPDHADASWARLWRTFRAIDLSWHGNDEARGLMRAALSLEQARAPLDQHPADGAPSAHRPLT